ncbi:MAG: Hemolysins and related proteins containing CBS domains [uncultured Rubrobacteraceae bacterium]|uniref:Hemolysins and related proteins containing CBS domains n=1 Tax=uncultured Rubrobacteraceae bacterium TaxID=349277 RepID=A0A6J4R531_9ACTN|nr:MAG: Hemolysins and related proteins containing CBS domains [uncultured Rubrobacteraceae bacterium]
MESIAVSGLLLFAALLLVALNGLFVAAEFAFVKIRSSKVDEMVQEGKSSAGIVKEAVGNLDGYLAVCQLGITISSLGLGALGEPAIATLIEPLLEPLGISDSTLHLISFVVGFGIITFLHVVFGELAAKSFAIAKPEGTSRFVAPFMKFFYYAFWPGVWLFNGTANAFVRMFGVPPASETEEAHSEEELRLIIGQSTNQGILKEDEEGMLRAVIQLEETRAREIMVPRPNVESLPAEMKLDELFSVVAEGNHTRYPLFEDDAGDRIVGMVHAKDVLRAAKEAGDLDAAVTARDLKRDVLTIPENRSVDKILKDLRAQGLQMAVVIDEWGSFEGLLTIEDIVEEIVGEIRDEFDEEGMAIQEHDGGYSIDGRVPIRDVNETLGSGFQSEDFDTVGGLVLGHLGRAPEVGDEFTLDSHVFRVDAVDGARVALVMVRKERS